MLNMHCVKYRRSIVRSKIFWNILFFLKIIIEYSERMCVCVKKWQSKHTCTVLMNWKLWIVSVFAVDGILVLKLLCLRSKAIVVYWWTQQLNTIWFELSKHIMNEFDSVEWHCERTPFGYGRWIGFQLCLCYNISPIERLHSFRYIAIAFTIIIKMNVYLKE